MDAASETARKLAAANCVQLEPLSGVSASTTRALTGISRAFGGEMLCISLCVCAVAAALVVLWFVGGAITRVMSEWRKAVTARSGAPPLLPVGHDDDVPRTLHGAADRLPPRPEAATVAARMARISGLYSSYNKAMQRDAARRGEVADDLIDRRILSRANDNYTYRRRHRDRLRFRRDDDGREWVSKTD